MILKIIAAVSQNGILGDGDLNDIPWKGRHPADFKFFREMTAGGAVIMGRRTYESIGRPLPKRANHVITRQEKIEGVYCHPSLEAYIRRYSLVLEDQITNKWLCGGANIYREGLQLPETKELYITLIPEQIHCANPIFFPWIDPTKFQMTELIPLEGNLQVAKYVRV